MKAVIILSAAFLALSAVPSCFAEDQAGNAKTQPQTQTQVKSTTHKLRSSDTPVYTCYAGIKCNGKVLGKMTVGGCPGIEDANSQMRSDDPYCVRVIHYHHD